MMEAHILSLFDKQDREQYRIYVWLTYNRVYF